MKNRKERIAYCPFFLANPELVEGAQRSQDTSAQPSAIATLDRITWRVDFDLLGVDHILHHHK